MRPPAGTYARKLRRGASVDRDAARTAPKSAQTVTTHNPTALATVAGYPKRRREGELDLDELELPRSGRLELILLKWRGFSHDPD
jgi:hypothetical protein